MTADIVGPVCETGDFFARDRTLPRTKPGDLLLLLDAGAYALALSSNYNTRPRPAELLIDTAANNTPATRLIRRRETLRDLLAPELP
jgi:diaminopimelate decarboxylase